MPALPNPDYLNHPRLKPTAARLDAGVREAALGQFLPAFQKAFMDWMRAGRPDYAARIGKGDPALKALQADGVVLMQVPPGLKARMAELAGPHAAALEAKLAGLPKPKFRDMNVQLDHKPNAELYGLVQTAFEALDVFAMAEAYLRRPVRIKRLYVQLNNAQETAARYGAIDEDGLPALKTDYWHIDSDVWPNFKALIYLDEVRPEQGPMRYVTGSHRWPDDFEMVVRKTNDTLRLPMDQFLALPEELRMHALFGPYLLGDEDGSRRMLKAERLCCGDGADVVLFDNNGVHRGGFVREGARRIIQCLFEAA